MLACMQEVKRLSQASLQEKWWHQVGSLQKLLCVCKSMLSLLGLPCSIGDPYKLAFLRGRAGATNSSPSIMTASGRHCTDCWPNGPTGAEPNDPMPTMHLDTVDTVQRSALRERPGNVDRTLSSAIRTPSGNPFARLQATVTAGASASPGTSLLSFRVSACRGCTQ